MDIKAPGQLLAIVRRVLKSGQKIIYAEEKISPANFTRPIKKSKSVLATDQAITILVFMNKQNTIDVNSGMRRLTQKNP